MAGRLPIGVPCAKGWVPFCLEEMSRQENARPRLTDLYNAVRSLAPEFDGLADVFGSHLLSRYTSAPKCEQIVGHLDRHWFDVGSRELFFPDEPVARIYGEGVLKTLELSLLGNPRPVSIQAWWIVDFPAVKILNLAETALAAEAQVTLLILTPRPTGAGHGEFILRREAMVWLAEQEDDRVISRQVYPAT